jgi:hypothetical protein
MVRCKRSKVRVLFYKIATAYSARAPHLVEHVRHILDLQPEAAFDENGPRLGLVRVVKDACPPICEIGGPRGAAADKVTLSLMAALVPSECLRLLSQRRGQGPGVLVGVRSHRPIRWRNPCPCPCVPLHAVVPPIVLSRLFHLQAVRAPRACDQSGCGIEKAFVMPLDDHSKLGRSDPHLIWGGTSRPSLDCSGRGRNRSRRRALRTGAAVSSTRQGGAGQPSRVVALRSPKRRGQIHTALSETDGSSTASGAQIAQCDQRTHYSRPDRGFPLTQDNSRAMVLRHCLQSGCHWHSPMKSSGSVVDERVA